MNYYRQVALSLEPCTTARDLWASDDAYVDKMRAILSAHPIIGVPSEPTAIAGGVYVGSTANAENIALLKSLGITYILNCGGSRNDLRYRRIRQFYPAAASGVQGYEELALHDSEGANIRPYFERAHAFIDYARARHAKVLIHCPGVSRSGAVAISYLVAKGVPLLEATSVVKQQRRCALANEGFMRQLVEYARSRGALEASPHHCQAPDYFRRLNTYRITTAHLPLYL